MSEYSDARSRPLAIGNGTDDRQQALREFGQLVLTAWDEKADYEDMTWVRNVSQGKSDTFPIIGRKRDASDHVPGELILGGTIEGDETEIFLDNIMYDSIFVADVDQMLSHFDFMSPYAEQLGESLSTTVSRRCAIMHILASRVTSAPYTGGPVPGYYTAADMRTNGASLEAGVFAAATYYAQNEINTAMKCMLPHVQRLLLSRYSGIEGGPVTTGSGNRASGTVGDIAGIPIIGTNHIPQGTISTGPVKYQGSFGNTVGHIGCDKAVGTLRRQGISVVQETQKARLGTLMIASLFEGKGILRQECSFELSVARAGSGAGQTF